MNTGTTTYDHYENADLDLDSLKLAFYSTSSLDKKMKIQAQYNTEIERQHQLLEELKIELEELEADKTLGNFRDTQKINQIIGLSQLPNIDYNMLKKLTTEIRSIQRSIPTTAKVTVGLEKELYYDESEVKVK